MHSALKPFASLIRVLAVALLLSGTTVFANQSEVEAAFQEAQKVQQPGPAEIALLDQGILKLPANQVFIPRPAADKIMTAFGNFVGEGFMGLVFGTGESDSWMAILKFEQSGYIKDDDAKNWDVEELFESIQAGTEEANKERTSRGIPELEIVGWVERPTYDAGPHQLIWSMAAKRKGEPNDASQSVNYNTYVLGRDGYISLNFITSRNTIEAQKPTARELLAALSFSSGKTYADFNSSTDRVAEYGLAALIGGVAAKKLGFFALIAVFAAKWFKLIAVAAVALFVGIRKFLGRKKGEE